MFSLMSVELSLLEELAQSQEFYLCFHPSVQLIRLALRYHSWSRLHWRGGPWSNLVKNLISFSWVITN